MANIIEIIIKAIDQASGVAEKANQKVTASNVAMAKSFEGVGIASDKIDKQLSEYGAAVDAVTRQQNQLKQAQLEAQSAAERLAQAQRALSENTDPSKLDALNKELINAQVQLDKAGKEVQDLSKNLRDGKSATDEAKGGFSNLQSAIVTVNQGMQLVSQVASQVSRAYDETVGKTVAYAKEVRDLSTNLGITTEETSKIIQASDDYGISVETVTGALQMAVKRGFAPNIETLAKLADEYNNIQSPTQRAARLSEVFGRGWTSLTPILKAGGQAIRDAAAEAEKLGLVLSDKDVQGARALEIQVDNLNDRVDALKLKMGKDLIPGLVIAAEDFIRLNDSIQGTTDPLAEAQLVMDRVTAAFGENSAAAAHARAEYEKVKKASDDQVKAEQNLEKQVGLTNKEKQLRLSMLPAELNGYSDSTQAILDEDRAMKTYNETYAKAMEERRNTIVATANLAIQYTESQKKQGDVQKELDALNEKIASHGPVRVATVAAEMKATTELTASQGALSAARAAADDIAKRDNESTARYAMRLKDAQDNLKKLTDQMGSHIVTANALSATDQKSALNQAKLAAAQEDLATAQKKKGETDAEFALRVETIKSKIGEYSKTLTEHTGVVGGATKAELEQKKALEEQIAALQKADEVDRAKGAFESLTQAFRDGILTEGQYQERATALNAVTGLYTDAALKQATAQESLMKSFADPRSEQWRGQLLVNQDAIDGLTTKTQDATKAAADLYSQTLAPLLVKVDVEPTVKAPKVEIDNAKLAHDLAGDMKFAQPTITPKIDTTQAMKDFDLFYTGKVGTIPAEKKTTAVLDKEAATKDVINLANLYNTLPKIKSTTIDVDAKLAQQQLDDILRTMSYITDKDVTVTTHYRTTGDRPEGFQRGIDMIVPPSPNGRTGDYFPFLAAPGERVTVQTPAQQAARQTAPVQSGDTYNYVTNVYNPLAAAMLADKQRRDRLARSNARMGVT